MKVTLGKKEQNEQLLTVEMTELEMETYYQQSLKKLAGQISVKGFRPGKVPLNAVEMHVSKEMIQQTAMEMALPVTYAEALEQEKIEAIGRPKVEIEKAWPLCYKAFIPLYPEVKVKNADKIKLVPKSVVVTDTEVDDEILRLRRTHSTFMKSNRPAEFGDRVEIDFSGFDEQGVALESTSSKNHPLVLGDNSFVPGFEEQIKGMVEGEKKEVKVTFPADYFHEPFQNKVVVFKVKVQRHEIMHTPDLDEAFVEKVTGAKQSVEEFKAEVKKSILSQKEQEEKNRLESEVLNKIVEITEVDLPPSLLEDEMSELLHQQKHEMKDRGVDWKQFLEATQQSEAELLKSKEQEAGNRLKLRFGINQTFKDMKIEVETQEVDEALKNELQILAAMNYSPQMNQIESLRLRLESRLKMEKLIKALTA